MSKVVTAVIVIAIGAVFFNYCDLFHLIVSLLLFMIGIPLLSWWKTRSQFDEEDEDIDEEQGIGQACLMGAVSGVCFLFSLAGASWLATNTPLYAWSYGRDCPDLLKEIHVLEDGKAYARIVELVDERLGHTIASQCGETLAEKKVRALLALAEQVNGAEHLYQLRQAQQAADGKVNADLGQIIATKLQTAEQKQIIENQRQKIERNEQLLQELQSKKLDVVMANNDVVVKLSDGLLFEVGKADLTDAAGGTLRQIAGILNRDNFKGKKVLVKGHTDARGDAAKNQELSRKRAERVVSALVEYGVGKERLEAQGYGASHPLAPNTTDAGQAKNRRVEIAIQK